METSDKYTNTLNRFKQEQQDCEIIENGSNEVEKLAIYFGVHIPPEQQQMQDRDSVSQVYRDRAEAMIVVKKYKKARFKVFNYLPEAMSFALNGYSTYTIGSRNRLNGHCNGYEDFVPVVNKENNTQSVGEKPAPFRGPKSQDLVKFRKAIESGNLELVRTTVWDNPRYLISNGDTPSILQEGSRYNALHIAAKAKNRKMCEIILSTISNNKFIRLLYGEDHNQDTNARANMLVDLYLNTPDKGTHESPLHFAVKLGAFDVVELLVSFPQCDKTLKNKFGYSLNMLICDRCDPKNTPSLPWIKKKIEMLLKDTYYVPVLRSQNNCLAPIIGEPFAPSSPPNLNTNLLFPTLEIKAYAGPMDKEGAEKFRRVWKTPPRSLVVNSPSKHNSSFVDVSPVVVKMRDVNKGVERVGRALASKFDVDWKEEWKFLGWFGDLSNEEGLDKLEKYLAEREANEVNVSSSGSSLLEGEILEISRNKSNNNCLSPISDLCKNFAAFNLSDNTTYVKAAQPVKQFKRASSADLLNGVEMLKSDLHPLFYLEKSCQVFAHRFTNAILNLDSDYDHPTVSLESQLKPLQQVISSFMNDARFVQVDFRLVHSRLGTLIGNKLKEYLIQENDHDFMKNTLEKWLETCSKRFDYFSSDDESCNHKQTMYLRKNSTSKNKQILCLLENVLSDFTFNERVNVTIKNEEECVSAWDKAKPCACIWRAESSRKSSLSKKSSRYLFKNSSSFKDDFVVARQLNFGSSDAASNSPSLCDNITVKSEINQSIVDENDDDDEEEDAFYTPPGSPLACDDELLTDNDVFEDSIYPEFTIFIEGDHPTKTDFDVFNSVNLAEDRLDSKIYPNIYKWHHAVSLYSEEERNSWGPVTCSSIVNSYPQINGTPQGSPLRACRSYPRSSQSFNL